jgi:hypothetical protein
MTVQSLFTRKFWIATAERAIRSFAASLASLLTASGTGLLETSWAEKLSVAGMAALVSILLAIGGGTFGKGDGPSFTGEEELKHNGKAEPTTAATRPEAPAAVEAPATVPAPAAPPEAERVPDKPVV